MLDYNRQELAIVSAYFFLLCFVNWFVGVDQAVVMGVQADRIHGLYDDANTMSTIFYVVSGYCLYRYAIARTVPHLLYGLFLIPMAYLGFNEKLNLFFLGLMLPLILFRLTRNPMHMLFAAIVGIALLSLTLGFAERSGLTGRTSTVSDLVRGRGGFGALGVIRSWPLAWEQISDHPATLLFGSGASNFGGAVAANRFNNGTATSITNEVFQFQTSAEYLGAFDSPTNYFTNVLAEFGLVGFLAIVGLLGFILRRLHTLGKKHRNPDLVAAAWAAKWGWVIVGMQALFVPFGAFGNLAVMVPIALATAVVVVEGRHLDRTSSDSAFTA
ncbi:MAG: hypothetical protein AUI89_05455 [Gemmatimonadetes bacterium 13_1_40CM_3_65_8]|nr:MAG: hypothetical protein AUH75_01980 [Gemmatimonadetes bacterium 13_1_40CM_4_65_7]OLD00777.1 MAG: hypothetical protein AUI89_05455 [Gemmatimonadetes bacterium 13_1_40CM_3_65_8]